VALGAAAVAIGSAAAGVETLGYAQAPLGHWTAACAPESPPVQLEGIAADDAATRNQSWSLLLDVERPARGRVRIVGSGMLPGDVVAGDRVAVWASLREPRNFGDPGAFDAVADARRAGIHALGFCKSGRLLDARPPVRRAGPARWAALGRRWARRQFATWILPGEEEGLVRAMVLGDRTGVSAETSEAFRMAGTYHVLAISGAQVALLAGVLLTLARAAGFGPASSGALVSLLLAFYAVFVGGDPPVARAAVMGIVMLLGRALDLDSDLPNLLGLAAFLLLCQRPLAVGDASFQLSFVATAGILLLLPPLLARLPRLPLRLETALAGSLAAQLPLTPLLAAHFHRLAPAALILNLVAVPLSSAVLLAGLALLACAAVVPRLAPLLGDCAWIAAHALLRSGEIARGWPALDVHLAQPAPWAVAVLITGLVLLARGARARRAFAFVAAGLAGLVWLPARVPADGRLHLTVLDVGQGDALVVRSPHGRVMVVDAGGAWEGRLDLGEAVVGPYLWTQGVLRLDRLVLTHAHPDHVGGAPFLVRSFSIGEIWEGPAPLHDPAYISLDALLRASHVARRSVVRGVHGSWDGVEIDVLGPRAPARPPWRVRNDDSVVVALCFGGVRFLLTGDMEAAAEAGLVAPPAAVLKVPHHGSRTSSTPSLLAAVSPRLGLISAGYRNRFGHPHPEVVARYRRAGVRLFQTPVDGAVTVSTDGSRIWVGTYRGGQDLRVQ
jgi:competence protein ComEC